MFYFISLPVDGLIIGEFVIVFVGTLPTAPKVGLNPRTDFIPEKEKRSSKKYRQDIETRQKIFKAVYYIRIYKTCNV